MISTDEHSTEGVEVPQPPFAEPEALLPFQKPLHGVVELPGEDADLVSAGREPPVCRRRALSCRENPLREHRHGLEHKELEKTAHHDQNSNARAQDNDHPVVAHFFARPRVLPGDGYCERHDRISRQVSQEGRAADALPVFFSQDDIPGSPGRLSRRESFRSPVHGITGEPHLRQIGDPRQEFRRQEPPGDKHASARTLISEVRMGCEAASMGPYGVLTKPRAEASGPCCLTRRA